MECGLKSLSSSSSPAASPSLMMACRPFPQPPLLPLPAHLQASPAPAGRQRQVDPRANKSPKKPAGGAASAPIVVAAPPMPAWTSMDSMYSVSPPPSSVPMPTSLLLAAGAGRKKMPTPCAVQVAGGGVDVGATDELRRLLRL
ncbi:hypothetical protein VPH35_099152 [Triticum aestivum]